MASSSSEKLFQPDSIKITSIENATVGHISLGPNMYSVGIILSQKDYPSSCCHSIHARMTATDGVKFCIGDILELLWFNYKRNVKQTIEKMVSDLIEKEKLPVGTTRFSYLDHTQINQMLIDVKALDLADYSFILKSAILHTISDRITAKSDTSHYTDLQFVLKHNDDTVKKLASAISQHTPYVANIKNCFKIDDYPEFKKLREALDIVFPPPKAPAKKRQRRY